MKAPIYKSLILFFLVGFSVSGNLRAQWKNIAPFKVINFPGSYPDPQLGAIHFKDGVLWAGWGDVWFSNDTGRTWQQSSINLAGGIVTDINFYDQLNGLLSTEEKGVFLTRDGGVTWKRILNAQHCTSVAFNGSPNIIHAITAGDVPTPTGLFHTSFDGGLTWSTSWPGGDFCETFAIAKDKTIYVLCSADNTGGLPGFVSFSTDLGKTWQQNSTEVDGDSYTICADSCSSKKLYVANEDYTATPNNLSEFYYSQDAGNSWVSAVAFPVPYLSGGMTCTVNTIYASSIHKGIYRSIDHGLTWKNIGGPNAMAFDSRNIACVNDNIVFALDADGSIWETTNSGGDSLTNLGVSDLVLSQNALFSTDSIIVCDTSISRSISLFPKGCTPPTLTKIEVIGSDSLSYAATEVTEDSINVNFLPLFGNLNSAQLLLTLSDGSTRTVTLGGFGIPQTPLTITTISNQNVDTLGASVTVPITINGLFKPENITVVMHYDTVLNYNGSLSPTGVKLDIPNEQWKGRTKLSIPNATSNIILGYAHFDVFNDTVSVQQVRFDSLTVPSSIAVCQYVYYPSPQAIASIITPLSGCGVLTISHFLHHGQVPELSIVPNPSTGNISITSSMDLGEVSVTVYDILGVARTSKSITLSKNSPLKLSLALGNGVYSVRVKSAVGSYDLRVVVNK